MREGESKIGQFVPETPETRLVMDVLLDFSASDALRAAKRAAGLGLPVPSRYVDQAQSEPADNVVYLLPLPTGDQPELH